MNDEMRDNLMGKYLDSEITPAEGRLLEGALADDAGARERLRELRALHASAREVVSAGMARGRSVEEIFGAAVREGEGRRVRAGMRRRWWLAAAVVGVAAGAAVVLSVLGREAPVRVAAPVAEVAAAEQVEVEEGLPLWRATAWPGRRTIYSFSDSSGAEWVVETSEVTGVSYGGDL